MATKNAKFVSQTVPVLMTAGTKYAVSVTMKNVGGIRWTSQEGYKLVANNPVWGVPSVDLSSAVLSGKNVKFDFMITAPTTGGSYNFQWRMAKGSVAFGDTTPNTSIVVATTPPPPDPTPPPPDPTPPPPDPTPPPPPPDPTPPPPQPTSPTGKRGLHFTQAEIDVWRKRIINGPYKDDWTDRIFPSGEAWRVNPEPRWVGCTTAGPITRDMEPSRTRDVGMMDCGFIYLLTGDTRYRTAVENSLLTQIKVAGTDLSNQTKWPRNGILVGAQCLNATILFTKWLHAYSYIRKDISLTNRTLIDAWFLKMATAYEAAIDYKIRNSSPERLPNRNVVGKETVGAVAGDSRDNTHSDGLRAVNPTREFHKLWVNIETLGVALWGSAAVMLNNTNLKNKAKQYFKEWMKYAHFPNGSVIDQNRWNSATANPSLGMSYLSAAHGPMIRLADAFARSGDKELMNYSTSEGLFGSQGGPKSLLKALQLWARLVLGTTTHYAAPGPTSNKDLKMSHVSPYGNKCTYIWMLEANVFHKDPTIRKACLTPIPSNSTTAGGYDNRRGDWGNLPGVRLMFGQMEDHVNPYPV